ncbi:MAG: DUF5053 domain-containing protein [Prevotella sp.]|nr:DUF5053 domain-containing protein [Prevotella sp.]
MATMVIKTGQETTMKMQLKDILLSVSWADLSKRYFGKSNSWLYHKLDGIDGNGGKGEFTDSEKQQLRGALLDLARRIRASAEAI